MRRLIVGTFVVLVTYIGFVGVALWYLGSQLDTAAAAAIVGALAGGLAGVVGSALVGWFASWQAHRESEDRIKSYASAQALELTKLDFELRREAQGTLREQFHQKKTFLAPLKVHRTIYNALFDLYGKGTWPDEPNKLGLLEILTYDMKQGEEYASADSSESVAHSDRA